MTFVLNRVVLGKPLFEKSFGIIGWVCIWVEGLDAFIGLWLGNCSNLLDTVGVSSDFFPWNCPDGFWKCGRILIGIFFFSEILENSGGSGGFRLYYWHAVLGRNFWENIPCLRGGFSGIRQEPTGKNSGIYLRKTASTKSINPRIRPFLGRGFRPGH